MNTNQKISKVKAKTLEAYRCAGRSFADWAREHNYNPRDAPELGDALVEWENYSEPSKTQLTQCVASLEFFYPMLRGKLQWAHASMAGWSVGHQAKHAIPLAYGASTLVGCNMSSRGRARLGLGCIIQNRVG